MSYERFCGLYPLPNQCRCEQRDTRGTPSRRRVWLVIVAFVISLSAIAGLAQGAIVNTPPEAIVVVQTKAGSGSGVVISPDGKVLTAEHVVGLGAVESVLYCGSKYPAKAVHEPVKNGVDEAYLLQFDAGGPVSYLPVAKQSPQVGDVVCSHGYPWVDYYSSNLGQVTELKPGGEIRVNFWVIEGNSGGPLLNAKGEVVGLASSRDALPGSEPKVKPGSTWIGLQSIQAALAKDKPAGAVVRPRGRLLYFTSLWCGPCQRVTPVVLRLKREGLPVEIVDTDKEPGLARQHGVKSTPTFLLIVDGQELERHVGVLSESSLRDVLARIPSAVPAPYRRSAAYGRFKHFCVTNETAEIADLFRIETPPVPPVPHIEIGPNEGQPKAEAFPPQPEPVPGPELEPEPEIDWSLVKIVVLRSNPGLSDDTGAVIAALQDRLGGPFRRRLQDLTEGKADVQLVHQQASPDRYAAVQAAVGREAGSLLVIVMVKQQDIGFIKGQIARQVESALSGYIDGKVPVEIVSERVHSRDYAAVEAALLTPESKDPLDNAPWWIAGASSLAAFVVGYLANYLRKRKAKPDA